ncbi:MAG: DUF4010 domain-containing protein, partial [Terriglobales bacterium]
RPDPIQNELKREYQPSNPLDIRAAFLFAGLFVGVSVAAKLAIEYIGHAGVFGLAALSGLTDVDPFILSMTESAGLTTPLLVAVVSILIAASSNNLMKGIYAYKFADTATGKKSLGLLIGLTIAGLLPLMWLR